MALLIVLIANFLQAKIMTIKVLSCSRKEKEKAMTKDATTNKSVTILNLTKKIQFEQLQPVVTLTLISKVRRSKKERSLDLQMDSTPTRISSPIKSTWNYTKK